MDVQLIKFRKDLGRRINQLRLQSKMSQLELAAKIGKDKQVINRYEKEGANPTAFILLAIANALNVTVDILLDFSSLTIGR